ncbi:30S ribosome-binding factor RbfA [Candidatus Zixiibacteriota bacterium]
MNRRNMAFKRTERVGDLLQREIGEIIEKDLKDPRIGMATITGVTVSPDLKHARVYFSVLGDEKVLRQTQQGLESAKYFIQGDLCRGRW